MKIVIFGASGMVGEGVLKESLLASDVTHITVIARKKLDRIDAKLDQIIIHDLYKTEYLQSIQNYDACFFCIGQSVTGLTEEEYQHVTYELTTRIAQALVTHNPDMTFIYVSGSGTDSSESGKTMWARIKGKTENALLKMDFKAVGLF
ncbi:NAD-dependent epimerase/dehydratase family protein [Acinetobacter baumannii]|uniref:NAD-dependent epimerase/dehydratase family protein n=1 Tax=Acinetobacter baumannii TaxID=470 RepID=UPI003F61EC3C